MDHQLTVIIPTFNEAENLPRLVEALLSLPLVLKILIVDDNSPDGTGRIADDLALRLSGKVSVLHRPGKSGLSSAYLQAYRSLFDTDTQLIAQMDADFSHDPKALIPMVEAIGSCDLVLGSRYIPGGSTDIHWPAWRKALSAWGNYYARTILNLPIWDVTGGFRLWKKETLMAIPLERVKASGYIFMVEMAYLAYRLGFKIREVPIYFADRRWGRSKMTFTIQLEAAVRVWKVLWDYRDLKKKNP